MAKWMHARQSTYTRTIVFALFGHERETNKKKGKSLDTSWCWPSSRLIDLSIKQFLACFAGAIGIYTWNHHAGRINYLLFLIIHFVCFVSLKYLAVTVAEKGFMFLYCIKLKYRSFIHFNEKKQRADNYLAIDLL